ncbi:MAG: peptidylprolyl isomerase [Candidatus Paceibacterota bacterium]
MKNTQHGYVAFVLLLLGILVVGYVAFKTDILNFNNTPEVPVPEDQVSSEPEREAGAVDQNQVTNKEDQKVTDQNNNKKAMQAVLHTSKGDITIEFSTSTPKTVENFTKLAKEGFYDGVKFHRVIKGFMSQGGDPLSRDDSKEALWGTGGPGYAFADEITPSNKNDKYTISMANAGPNTNGSQFFINATNNNFLDTKHTVFGKVVAGMDVVDAINKVATDASDRPLEPVVIKSITLK